MLVQKFNSAQLLNFWELFFNVECYNSFNPEQSQYVNIQVTRCSTVQLREWFSRG